MTTNPKQPGNVKPHILKTILLLFMTAVTCSVSAQQITLRSKLQTREQAIENITAHGYNVIFNSQDLYENIAVDFGRTELPLRTVLDKLTEGTGLAYTVDGERIVIYLDDARQTITGTVRNADGEALAGAGMEILDMPGSRATTDKNGRFRIAGVSAGNRIVKIVPADGSEVRYREVTVAAGRDTDVTLTLGELTESAVREQSAPIIPATPATTYFIPREEAVAATYEGPGTDMFLVSGSQIDKNYHPKAAVKTNLLVWGTTTPNVAVEFGLAPKWTLDVSAAYNPFQLERGGVNHVTIVSPEVRYWFCRRFERHFIGLHALGGTFNIGDVTFLTKTFETTRYNGWGVGAGLSYGYHLPMGKRWAWEFTVGVGYVYLQYGKYRCEGCDDYLGKDRTHYFGPTKAGISLIFMIK